MPVFAVPSRSMSVERFRGQESLATGHALIIVPAVFQFQPRNFHLAITSNGVPKPLNGVL